MCPLLHFGGRSLKSMTSNQHQTMCPLNNHLLCVNAAKTPSLFKLELPSTLVDGFKKLCTGVTQLDERLQCFMELRLSITTLLNLYTPLSLNASGTGGVGPNCTFCGTRHTFLGGCTLGCPLSEMHVSQEKNPKWRPFVKSSVCLSNYLYLYDFF